MSGRILSIDYGTKRIGLAISDPLKMIATPLERVLTGKDHKETAHIILAAVKEKGYTIEKVILGEPKHLSGNKSTLSEIVHAFKLAAEPIFNCPLVLVDERLTSKQGEKLLMEAGMKRKKRGSVIDSMSACLLLQAFLSMPGI